MDPSSAIVKHKISVEEYDRMVDAGAFAPDARLELIDGEILEMPPISPEHASRVDCLLPVFIRLLGDRAHVRCQGPVHMGRYSEPEPDLLLLKPRADKYSTKHPAPEDVLLVVEVAKSSLAFDRDVKAGLYKGEAVLEYGIVNLVDDVLEVRRREEPGVVRVLRRGDTVSLAAFPDISLKVEEVLGPALP